MAQVWEIGRYEPSEGWHSQGHFASKNQAIAWARKQIGEDWITLCDKPWYLTRIGPEKRQDGGRYHGALEMTRVEKWTFTGEYSHDGNGHKVVGWDREEVLS